MPLPWWKLKRELRRIGRQIGTLPRRSAVRFLSGPYNAFLLSRKARLLHGALPDGPRRAI